MKKRLRILLTNDDGYEAPGLTALRQTLGAQHDIITVAPDQERSGTSAAITLTRALHYSEVDTNFYKVDAHPADCALLALRHISKNNPPDIVISGINRGPNLGDDTIYSGTVGAASVSCLEGLPALAVSMGDFKEPMRYDTGAMVIARLLESSSLLKVLRGRVLNINIPNTDIKLIKGYQETLLARRHYQRHFDIDPETGSGVWYARGQVGHDEAPDSDAMAIESGYISLTFLRPHLLDEHAFHHGLGWAPPSLDLEGLS